MSFIKCRDFDFIFQSQKDCKPVVSECKKEKRTRVLFYVKTAFLFGGGTFAMAICLISDALSLSHVAHTNRLLTAGPFPIMPFTPKPPKLLVGCLGGEKHSAQKLCNNLSAYLIEMVSVG